MNVVDGFGDFVVICVVMMWCAVCFWLLVVMVFWFCRCLWVCLFVILFGWVVGWLLVLVSMVSWCLLVIDVYLLMLWLYYACVCTLFGGLNLLVCFVYAYIAFVDCFIGVVEGGFGNSVVFSFVFCDLMFWLLVLCIWLSWIVVDFSWLGWWFAICFLICICL